MGKKLIINGKFLTQRQTGAQRYAREIVFQLDSLSKKGELLIVVPEGEWNIPDYMNIKVQEVGPFKGMLWEQITLPIYALLKGLTILNLCNVAPLLKPDYSTIHDLKIILYPHFYGWKFRYWYRFLFINQTKRCKAIFTVSEQVKEDLANNYPRLNSNRIIVTSDSWQHFERIVCDEQTLIKYGLEKDNFYFAMGSLEPNKNFKWVAEMARRDSNNVFAVAGSINTKVFADGLGFDCPKNMKLLGYVSDEEAKTLMRDAKAFLFPSFCEGFGMPPLEALSAGVSRVIVSDIPVMHEIFEDNAIYIDPNQYDYQLDELIEHSTCDANSVLSRFSWKESARKIYEVITNNY